ncbi:MAG: hypothetical protein AB1798_22725, partial [Spirochaetota bacterium]
VIDNEAGLEHISRRTRQAIDCLIVVVNDNPLSFEAALKIQTLTEDLSSRIKKKYIVTNMVRDFRRPVVDKWLSELKIDYLCNIEYDSVMEDLVFQGEPLSRLGDTPAKSCIKKIIETIGGFNGNT